MPLSPCHTIRTVVILSLSVHRCDITASWINYGKSKFNCLNSSHKKRKRLKDTNILNWNQLSNCLIYLSLAYSETSTDHHKIYICYSTMDHDHHHPKIPLQWSYWYHYSLLSFLTMQLSHLVSWPIGLVWSLYPMLAFFMMGVRSHQMGRSLLFFCWVWQALQYWIFVLQVLQGSGKEGHEEDWFRYLPLEVLVPYASRRRHIQNARLTNRK